MTKSLKVLLRLLMSMTESLTEIFKLYEKKGL